MDKFHAFLSYSEEDSAAAKILERRLREEANLNPYLDTSFMIPGLPRQEQLEQVLSEVEAIAVLVGPSGIEAWHNEQMRIGIERAVRECNIVRVIPVLLPGAAPEILPLFLGARVHVRFQQSLSERESFDCLVAGILGHPPKDAAADPRLDIPSPYPGLEPFTAQQAGLFFGRNEEYQRLRERVESSPFVAVVGASGSGKSSLVLAGLLPKLESNWRVLVLTPGARAIRELANQWVALAAEKEQTVNSVTDLMARCLAQADGLSNILALYLAQHKEVAKLLIVVDQFEELFTQTTGMIAEDHQQQRQFIANLVDVTRSLSQQVCIVITLRADFVRHCLDFPELSALLESRQLLLGPLTEQARREIIIMPAQKVGAMFEEGLVTRILAEWRNQPAALPLVQFALAQLWQRRYGLWLTHNAYDESGGISGAIDQSAERVYTQLNQQTQQPLAHNLFLRLVTFDETTNFTRRRIHRDELQLAEVASHDVDEVISKFADRNVRLIMVDAHTIELAHEALIERWERLQRWLNEDRSGLHIHRRLTEIATIWEERNRNSSYLYRGSQLAEATKWAKQHHHELNQLERAFLKASVVTRTQHRLQQFMGGLLGLLIVIGIFWMAIAEQGLFARRVDWSTEQTFSGSEVSVVTWDTHGTMYVGLGEKVAITNIARRRANEIEWEWLDAPAGFVSALLPDPVIEDAFYVALYPEALLWVQEGESHVILPNDTLSMQAIIALAVSPTGMLYVGDSEQNIGIYSSQNHGQTWQPVPDSPQVRVYYLGWSNNHLLAGTPDGVWSYTEHLGWTHPFSASAAIYSALEVGGTLIAGGEGIFEIRVGDAPLQISAEEINNIIWVPGVKPYFAASSVDGNLLWWLANNTKVNMLARGVDLGNSAYTYVIQVQPQDPTRLWVGTENGLHYGRMRHWYEAKTLITNVSE
jgi:energy-coupling factor transporter ATP-binding protein EcfA2